MSNSSPALYFGNQPATLLVLCPGKKIAEADLEALFQRPKVRAHEHLDSQKRLSFEGPSDRRWTESLISPQTRQNMDSLSDAGYCSIDFMDFQHQTP